MVAVVTVSPTSVPDPFQIAAERFRPKRTYQTDPHGWIVKRLSEFLWGRQQEIVQSVRDNRYTAVPSAHDAGKSFTASRVAAWWIDAHPPGEAFVISTAPTSAQVGAILWREIGKAHKKALLPGSITTAGYPMWKLDGEIVGYGRKPAEYSDAAFQGIHNRYVLVVIDEASGISKTLFDAVDALATNEYARVLAIGNPDDPNSHFASICRPDSGWNVIRIDGLRTPNFTRERVEGLVCAQCRKIGRESTLLRDLFEAEGLAYTSEVIPDDLRPMLLSPLWVEERLHRWVGRTTEAKDIAQQAAASSLFTAKVRGLFPSSSSEGVIPLGWVELAMARWRDWSSARERTLPGATTLGVDVAGSGTDESCIATRTGLITHSLEKYPQVDTMEVAAYVAAKLNPYGSEEILGKRVWTARAAVDVIGIGSGVYDRLRELDYPVEPFVASGSATGLHDRSGEFGFTTLRSAAWWNLRELLDPSRGYGVMLPDDEMLKADLCSPRWKNVSGGKIKVEPKDEVRKRLGRSTDAGDAVVMSYFNEIGAMDAPGEPDVVPWHAREREKEELTVHRWVDDHADLDINPDVRLDWDGLEWPQGLDPREWWT